jgi:hypothetical protein
VERLDASTTGLAGLADVAAAEEAKSAGSSVASVLTAALCEAFRLLSHLAVSQLQEVEIRMHMEV